MTQEEHTVSLRILFFCQLELIDVRGVRKLARERSRWVEVSDLGRWRELDSCAVHYTQRSVDSP